MENNHRSRKPATSVRLSDAVKIPDRHTGCQRVHADGLTRPAGEDLISLFQRCLPGLRPGCSTAGSPNPAAGYLPAPCECLSAPVLLAQADRADRGRHEPATFLSGHLIIEIL